MTIQTPFENIWFKYYFKWEMATHRRFDLHRTWFKINFSHLEWEDETNQIDKKNVNNKIDSNRETKKGLEWPAQRFDHRSYSYCSDLALYLPRKIWKEMENNFINKYIQNTSIHVCLLLSTSDSVVFSINHASSILQKKNYLTNYYQ